MDIKREFEPKSINELDLDVVIKKEPELIIDNDCQWTPTKFEDEENDYYQEYFEECKQISVKDGNAFESYTIKFLDGDGGNMKDTFDGNDSDYYPEDEDEYENSSSDEDFDAFKECFDFRNVTEKQEAPDSEVQMQLNRWLAATFVGYECPECSERFFKYAGLRKHLEQNHEESIEETEKNYFIGSDNCGVCKKCNKEFSTILFRYFHSLKHNKNDAELEIIICKICNFKTKCSFVQCHILEEHSEVTKEFKMSSSLKKTKIKCPLCPYTYKTRKQLWYHFMDKHPCEYNAKTIYTCHLCVQENFNEENLFLHHLTENHNLNSWQILNYRRVLQDKDYVACTECGCLFFQNDTIKLLKHFIKHESNISWTCKFCSKKSCFKKTPLRHMCFKIIEYYNNHNYEANIITSNNLQNNGWQIKNLQEFEKYVAHVCPFCNKEFSKMLIWQQHLRKVHAIETLKGLEMKKIGNESNKLSCIICHALVVNSPEKLHAHRFQHLPFKPYKCLLCCSALNTFKIAVNHVSGSCKNEDDKSFIKNIWTRNADDSNLDIRSFLEIQCSLCNHTKFNDVRSSYNHYEDVHNNFKDLLIRSSDNSVTCKICYKKLVHSKKNPLFLHIINHFDEKTFQCKLCLQSYATLKGISYHFLSHPSTKSLYYQTYKRNDIENETLNVKKDNKPATNVTSLAASSIKSYVLNEFAEFIGFVCPECNVDMGSQPKWHTHIATKHNFFSESDIYFKDVDGSLKCTTCKMKLPTSTNQQQKHKLTHMPYKSFMCNLCYKRCNTLGVLYGHFRRKHFAGGTFVCPICPDILQTSHERTKHLKEKHPREEWPETMCSICYKIMSTNGSLRGHMKTHDADRVKHTCEICGAKIIELKDFNLHLERHKKKGEVKEKAHDETLQQKLTCQSNDIQQQLTFLNNSQCVSENENKRKLDEKLEVDKAQIICSVNHIPDFVATKKIKNEPQEV